MSHQSSRYDFQNKPADYASLAQELEGLLNGEHDLIANAANATSLIYPRPTRHQLVRRATCYEAKS